MRGAPALHWTSSMDCVLSKSATVFHCGGKHAKRPCTLGCVRCVLPPTGAPFAQQRLCMRLSGLRVGAA